MIYSEKSNQLHKDHKIRTQYGFVLPTILVLSVVLLTLGLSVFQLTSTIARSLTDQYWQRLATQATQAGVSYMSACVDQGLGGGVWPASITQDNTCLGAPTSTPQSSLYTNASDTNSIPNAYKSSFTIYKPTTGLDGIAKVRVVGTVNILNSLGNTIKTYTSEMTVIINGFTGFLSQLSVGKTHGCALSNGKVYCWGKNHQGQLGNNTTTDSGVPTAVYTGGVLAGKVVTNISTGHGHTCVIADGQVYCWGRNSDGALGNNSSTTSVVPVAVNTSGVLAGKVITQIATGGDHACVLADNMPYCWGDNQYGQLGNGNNTDSKVPVAVDTSGVLAGKVITQIVSGHNSDHTCALADGQAYCWGYNSYGGWTFGQLGNGSNSNSNIPVAVNTAGVLAGKAVTQITTGQAHTCALADGQAYCWGYNSNGALGNSGGSSNVPTTVDTSGVLNDKTIEQISAGDFHTCVVADGKAYCWGWNGLGALGNGSTSDSSTPPVAVNTAGVLASKAITQIVSGVFNTCALANGQAYCWGDNGDGQLGNNSTTNTSVPVKVYPIF